MGKKKKMGCGCSCEDLIIGIPKGTRVQVYTDNGNAETGEMGEIVTEGILQLKNPRGLDGGVLNICCSKINTIHTLQS
ncbi:hypothetical protein [Oceanobacillus senegalensis]|uniref:hypothetical protein n=1 Tax=Oceanobacillus senegalensis TaxID=1936063 RepID=UPI000A305BEE|nr:hypothetical protein [Oceanobacillus senegalensis]